MFTKDLAYGLLLVTLSLILLAFAFHFFFIAFVPSGFCVGVIK